MDKAGFSRKQQHVFLLIMIGHKPAMHRCFGERTDRLVLTYHRQTTIKHTFPVS